MLEITAKPDCGNELQVQELTTEDSGKLTKVSDLTDGTKRKVVKQYLLEHPERVQEDTHKEMAQDLGVSRGLVSRIINEDKDVKDVTRNGLTTGEKRDKVRSYCDENPDASNREIAREVECDVTHVTVLFEAST